MEDKLLTAMLAWQRQHRDATLVEIEAELDRLVAEMRVRVLEETLKENERDGAGGEVSCPECGTKMYQSGRRRRRLRTKGEQELVLERAYICCPRCGRGFFPPRP